MKNKSLILPILLFFLVFPVSNAQDLEDILESQVENQEDELFAEASFKSTRLITGHSIKNPAKGDLIFLISHRFGRVNQGIREFFGLDISTIRLGFEYGLTDRLALGIGRSSFNKTVDGYFKYKILRQRLERGSVPLSLSVVASSSVKTAEWENAELDYLFAHRVDYCYQLLFARKFNSRLSLQLSPGVIHRNLVEFASNPNDIYFLGLGGRYKISNRISINAEYFYPFDNRTRQAGFNPLSIGLDIETGGHVFQLMASNSRGMTEGSMIPFANGDWAKGDVHFGFNITRTF
jgi:hypothetical protein